MAIGAPLLTAAVFPVGPPSATDPPGPGSLATSLSGSGGMVSTIAPPGPRELVLVTDPPKVVTSAVVEVDTVSLVTVLVVPEPNIRGGFPAAAVMGVALAGGSKEEADLLANRLEPFCPKVKVPVV